MTTSCQAMTPDQWYDVFRPFLYLFMCSKKHWSVVVSIQYELWPRSIQRVSSMENRTRTEHGRWYTLHTWYSNESYDSCASYVTITELIGYGTSELWTDYNSEWWHVLETFGFIGFNRAIVGNKSDDTSARSNRNPPHMILKWKLWLVMRQASYGPI